MGATGISGSSTSKNNAILEFQDGNTTIKFDEELVYADTKQEVSPAARKTMADFEGKNVSAKREHSILMLMDGTIIEENKGGKSSVKASLGARMTADMLSHNHPREEGVLGGTFSSADISNFVDFHQGMYRAVAKEGTYVIRKVNGFDKQKGEQFLQALKKFEKQQDKEIKKYRKLLSDDAEQQVSKLIKDGVPYSDAKVKSKEIYAKANKKLDEAQNRLLIATHNFFRSEAGKYGLRYGLEKN